MWLAISLVGAGAVAIGMATNSDLAKIVGIAVLFTWTPIGGVVLAYLGVKKRRQATLLESFAADRAALTKVEIYSVFLYVQHRDGRSLDLDCGGMLMRDVEAVAAHLKSR